MNPFLELRQLFDRILANLFGVAGMRSPQAGSLPLEYSPNRVRPRLRQSEQVRESLLGLLRAVLAFIIVVIIFPAVGGALFETITPADVAARFRAHSWLLNRIPDWVLYRFDPRIARYMIAPLFAIIAIFIAGASYVRDIYNLREVNKAMRYVLASMFGINYPTLRIDRGKKDIIPGETNLLDAIGGPGTVLIEPGNAAIFRKLNEASDVSITQAYFMEPFETIGAIASLEDQEGLLDDVMTVSRDGIRLRLRDVRFRYRIVPMLVDGRVISRTLESPYPYSEEAMRSMAYNLSINADGPDPWAAAVQRTIRAAITDYIQQKTIDELTAPRSGGFSPRDSMRIELFSQRWQKSLRDMGAELVWIDVGHIDIVSDEVDQQRVEYWATDWVGSANKTRAYGEARRIAYREQGRAEAQAEMIMAIASAFEGVNLSENSKENLRTMILVRTAQILEAIRDTNREDEDE